MPFTDVVQEIGCSYITPAESWNRGYVTPSFPAPWKDAFSPVLFYTIPQDGDCVGDIDVVRPAVHDAPMDVAIYFDNRILWSGNTGTAPQVRLPFGGVNMLGARGHPIHVVLKNNAAEGGDATPRVMATFRRYDSRTVRLALFERSAMRDLLIRDWSTPHETPV